MKIFLTILLLNLVIQFGFGQDIISTNDKKQVNVRIIEKTNKYVRYKMNDYADGPVIWIRTNRIFKIEYKNGVVDPMGNQNPRKNRPLGISAGFAKELTGGGGLGLSTLDYFVIPQIDLEMNIGSSDISTGYYFSAGSRFHLNTSSSEHKFTPFTGLLFGYNYGVGFVQVPAGINWIGGSGLSASISINQMITLNSWSATFAEVRIGWRFKL